MRVIYSHRVQSRDGQSVHIDEMVAALRADGHEVEIVGPASYAATGFGGESRTIAALRRMLPGVFGEIAELAYAVLGYARLRRAVRAFRPDLIYERYNLYHLAGALMARRGTPLFLEVNSPLAEERAQFGGLRLGRLARAIERATWRSATRVLTVTEVLRQIVVGTGVEAGRVDVLPNAIVAERYAAPVARGASGDIVLGFVGFVRDWHGLDRIIAAMAAAAGVAVRLVVVGDGPARPGLERQVAELGLTGRVEFRGVVSPGELSALVSSFDIALQPRATAYASPLKLFDYMAAGCAIVAPDQPNIREILSDGVTALLFDPDQAGALWDAVERLVADSDLRRRLGEAARTHALRDFTWQNNARRVTAWAAADLAGRVGGAGR